MDMLVEQTHDIRHEYRNNERDMRYTDTRLDEQQRGVSLKMVPMSLLLEASSGKSYLMNMIDTPGDSPPQLAPCQRFLFKPPSIVHMCFFTEILKQLLCIRIMSGASLREDVWSSCPL